MGDGDQSRGLAAAIGRFFGDQALRESLRAQAARPQPPAM